ncbi:MAG: energy transducer TonB [Erythrobacter sp.]
MAFTDQTSLKHRGAGLAGATIIPAALGALLITGLAVTQIANRTQPKPLTGVNVPLPPPPPPKPDEATPERAAKNTQVYTPPRRIEAARPEFTIGSTDALPPQQDEIDKIVLPPVDGFSGTGGDLLKPVGASPRNDPGGWVTTDDYRSSWIARGMTGTARFELAIAPNGRVTSCRITRSTGHAVLDEATCRLITQRARFDPASDASGNVAAGSYSSSIRWFLPD